MSSFNLSLSRGVINLGDLKRYDFTPFLAILMIRIGAEESAPRAVAENRLHN